MKIGIVAPGIWNSIHLDMAQALGALGHDVAVYTEDRRAPSGARFMPLRWVVCIHDSDYLRLPLAFPGRPVSRWKEAVKLWVLRSAGLVRANSYVTRDALAAGGCAPGRIRVVPLHITGWMRIDAFLAGGVPPFAGGAITAQLDPRRIAAMLVELGREVVSHPA